jgi:hypothetical protein
MADKHITDGDFEIEQVDQKFMSLLDDWNHASELYQWIDAENYDLHMARYEQALYEHGAWVDREGLWRAPARKRHESY